MMEALLLLQEGPSTMGNRPRKEELERMEEELEGFRKGLKEVEDFGVHWNLERFTSSSSTHNLRRHYSRGTRNLMTLQTGSRC